MKTPFNCDNRKFEKKTALNENLFLSPERQRKKFSEVSLFSKY